MCRAGVGGVETRWDLVGYVKKSAKKSSTTTILSVTLYVRNYIIGLRVVVSIILRWRQTPPSTGYPVPGPVRPFIGRLLVRFTFCLTNHRPFDYLGISIQWMNYHNLKWRNRNETNFMFTRDRVTGWPATGSLLKETKAVGGCHGRYNPLINASWLRPRGMIMVVGL